MNANLPLSNGPLFSLRERLEHVRIPAWVVTNPTTGELCSQRTLHQGHLQVPATFAEDVARAAALRLAKPFVTWELIPYHGDCPQCGRRIGANDLNFLYNAPTGWRAACHVWEGGCGHEASGATRDDALKRWGSPHLVREPGL